MLPGRASLADLCAGIYGHTLIDSAANQAGVQYHEAPCHSVKCPTNAENPPLPMIDSKEQYYNHLDPACNLIN